MHARKGGVRRAEARKNRQNGALHYGLVQPKLKQTSTWSGSVCADGYSGTAASMRSGEYLSLRPRL